MKNQKLGTALLKVAVRFERDIVTARQKTRRLSQILGFDDQDQARLATAISELCRNVYQYAGSGTVEYFLTEKIPQTLFIRVSDSGPGIASLDDILNGVYVSKSGMGVGLIGTKKLMDHFAIESTPGQGTQVTIGKDFDRRAEPVTKDSLGSIADRMISKNGENPFEEIQNQNRDLLNALEEVRASRGELATLNRELAETNRGVVALYAELDEKAASLQRANELKTSFLSNMTHEFRTPLSSVISLTRLLLDRTDGDLTLEQLKQVNYIRSSSEGLLELVNDLLDLAKVEAGKVAINVSLFLNEEVMSSLRGMFRPILGSNASVELEIEAAGPTFEFETDQAKVSQILRNLVSNAIKYTENGRITVTSRLDELDIVHFEVTDTGIGIEPKHLELIFEDFSQVDSKMQKRSKGTGLGLPLSRKLARLLGGEVHVKSVVNEGSTFCLDLPRRFSGAHEGELFSNSASVRPLAADSLGHNQASSQFKILLVDDDEASRYVLRTLVNAELKADFLEAANGREGLDLIKKWRPDLVFLDLTMPELDGFDVLRAMKNEDARPRPPVIVNTAKPLTPDEEFFLAREASSVLSKTRTEHVVAVHELQKALLKAGFDYKQKLSH